MGNFEYEYATAWVPEKGDVLEGKVVSIDTSPEGAFGAYPIITIESERDDQPNAPKGERRAFHAYHDVATNALKGIRPNVGDRIGVKYMGQIEPESGGNPYHDYRVQAERGGFDWEQLQHQPPAQVPAGGSPPQQ